MLPWKIRYNITFFLFIPKIIELFFEFPIFFLSCCIDCFYRQLTIGSPEVDFAFFTILRKNGTGNNFPGILSNYETMPTFAIIQTAGCGTLPPCIKTASNWYCFLFGLFLLKSFCIIFQPPLYNESKSYFICYSLFHLRIKNFWDNVMNL